MKSNPGTLRLTLFLFSIFFYVSLFSQVSISPKLYKVGLSEAIASTRNSNPRFSVSKTASISSKGFFKLSLSISDTTKKDRDSDGVPDSLDKCPDEKGAIQYDGCPVPDTDNDGIADDVDACPTVRGSTKYKGCPIPDTDGDKINDEDDKCPNQPGVARYDGCPVGDKDGDGVNDDDDKCIAVAGTVTNAGCPENNKNLLQPSKEKRKKKGE